MLSTGKMTFAGYCAYKHANRNTNALCVCLLVIKGGHVLNLHIGLSWSNDLGFMSLNYLFVCFDCRVTMLVRKKKTKKKQNNNNTFPSWSRRKCSVKQRLFFHATSTAVFSDSVLQKVHIPFLALGEFRVSAC